MGYTCSVGSEVLVASHYCIRLSIEKQMIMILI